MFDWLTDVLTQKITKIAAIIDLNCFHKLTCFKFLKNFIWYLDVDVCDWEADLRIITYT